MPLIQSLEQLERGSVQDSGPGTPLQPSLEIVKLGSDSKKFAFKIKKVPLFAGHKREFFNEATGEMQEFIVGTEWLEVAAKVGNVEYLRDYWMAAGHMEHHPMPGMPVNTHDRLCFLVNFQVEERILMGNPVPVLFADLLVETERQLYEIMDRPYRSVEIADMMDPRIGSLAFMHSEEPFFRLPIPTFKIEPSTVVEESIDLEILSSVGYSRRRRNSNFLYKAKTKFVFKESEEMPLTQEDMKAIGDLVGSVVDAKLAAALQNGQMPGADAEADDQTNGEDFEADDGDGEDMTGTGDGEGDITERQPVAMSRQMAKFMAEQRAFNRAVMNELKDSKKKASRVNKLQWARNSLAKIPAARGVSDAELKQWHEEGHLEAMVETFRKFAPKGRPESAKDRDAAIGAMDAGVTMSDISGVNYRTGGNQWRDFGGRSRNNGALDIPGLPNQNYNANRFRQTGGGSVVFNVKDQDRLSGQEVTTLKQLKFLHDNSRSLRAACPDFDKFAKYSMHLASGGRNDGSYEFN